MKPPLYARARECIREDFAPQIEITMLERRLKQKCMIGRRQSHHAKKQIGTMPTRKQAAQKTDPSSCAVMISLSSLLTTCTSSNIPSATGECEHFKYKVKAN
jgi:hypothetical protein